MSRRSEKLVVGQLTVDNANIPFAAVRVKCPGQCIISRGRNNAQHRPEALTCGTSSTCSGVRGVRRVRPISRRSGFIWNVLSLWRAAAGQARSPDASKDRKDRAPTEGEREREGSRGIPAVNQGVRSSAIPNNPNDTSDAPFGRILGHRTRLGSRRTEKGGHRENEKARHGGGERERNEH